MSAWKSRWSWVRLVNSATSKWIASARCRASACEETSIAQARSPLSSMRRKVACRSIASGVVRSTSSSAPPTTCFTVPSSPLGSPPPRGSRGPGRRSSSCRWSRSPRRPAARAVGSPLKRAASGAIAARASATSTCGTASSSSRSTTSAAAPAATDLRGELVPVALLARARRRTASPARPCGCRRRARSPRSSRHRRPGLRSNAAASSSSLIDPILGTRSGGAATPIPAPRRGTAARRRRSGRRPAPRPSRRRFRPAAGRRSPPPAASGSGPAQSR